MIFKQIDDKSKEISTLKNLLHQSNSESQKKLIAQDLKSLENGYQAEKDNAYYLDFAFEEGERNILLHDIRIEHNGRTAQFDHILIARIGIILLESKSFTGPLTINNDNSLTVTYGKNVVKTFPNPIEQNNRHREVLSGFIKDNLDMSLRFKLLGGVNIQSKVLIHPNTTVTNDNLPEGFERSDSFVTNMFKEIDEMGVVKVFGAASTVLLREQTRALSELLVAHHKPKQFDYTKKYRISNQIQKQQTDKSDSVSTKSVKEEVQNCPRCKDGTLVKRKRKSKKYADKYESDEFYGCSRFPKCKFTQEI
jgi:hypothetical protein